MKGKKVLMVQGKKRKKINTKYKIKLVIQKVKRKNIKIKRFEQEEISNIMFRNPGSKNEIYGRYELMISKKFYRYWKKEKRKRFDEFRRIRKKKRKFFIVLQDQRFLIWRKEGLEPGCIVKKI
jgi:hypothetical protein